MARYKNLISSIAFTLAGGVLLFFALVLLKNSGDTQTLIMYLAGAAYFFLEVAKIQQHNKTQE